MCAEHETYPAIPDVTSDFVYLRLQKGKDTIKTGYPPKELDAWAERLKHLGERRRAERFGPGRSKSRRRPRRAMSSPT